MTRLLIGLGVFLIAWGAFVLVTGDFVATLDIAAGLIASGAGVIAVSGVVTALNRIAETLSERQQHTARPAEMPRPVVPVPQVDPRPAPERRPPVEQERRPPQAEPAQPETERRPEAAEPRRREAPPAAEGPKLIREGVIEGQRYRFYDDGSIEAEGPRGIRRFRSIDEAREQIMRERTEQQQNPKPAPAAPPAATPERRPADERAPRMLAEAPDPEGPKAAKPPEPDLTWDAYLSGGRKGEGEGEGEPARPPEDDQWSEPFRMLLRGDPPPPNGKPPKR